MVKLKYVSAWFPVITNGAAPSTRDEYWAWNNLFDLNFTGGGTQPLYYDQYAEKWIRNTVYSAKILVEYANDNAQMAEVTVIPTHNPAAHTFPTNNIQELPYAHHATSADVNQGAPVTRVGHYTSYSKMMGSHIRDQLNEAVFGFDVTDPTYFWVHYQSIDNATTIGGDARVTLILYCKMFEPKISSMTGS